MDIDGDGSFLMNIQELATAHIEKIAAKAIILNNQHLGMVMQWEDRFYAGNRGNTYLGDPGQPDADLSRLRARLQQLQREVRARDVSKRTCAPPSSGCSTPKEPYVLDIIVPYTEHVLPFIPAGRTVADMIWKA